jgi:hypothetical protein
LYFLLGRARLGVNRPHYHFGAGNPHTAHDTAAPDVVVRGYEWRWAHVLYLVAIGRELAEQVHYVLEISTFFLLEASYFQHYSKTEKKSVKLISHDESV